MTKFGGKTFEGKWWQPDRLGDVFAGTLRLEEDYSGTLTIKGSESMLAVFMRPDSRTLFGQMDDHYRYDVTLFRTGLIRGPSSGSPRDSDRETEVQFFTNTILVGDHIASEEERAVSAAWVHITGLGEWCDTSGFSGRMEKPGSPFGSERVDLSYHGSSSDFYPIGSGRALRLVSHYRGPMFFNAPKKVAMSEQDLIELRFDDDLSITQLIHEIGIWQSFMTFALRRPSYIDEVRVTLDRADDLGFGCSLLVPGRRTEAAIKNRRVGEVLFTKSVLGDRIGSCVEAWRRKYDDVEMPVMLFTGTAYQSDAFLHSQLLTCLQALEVLHRDLFEGSRFPDKNTRKETIKALRWAIPGTLDPGLRDEISQQLGFIGDLTLLDRLKVFLNLYSQSLRPLFPAGDLDMALLKDVRNFLTHYGRGKGLDKEFLESRKLLILAEKAKLFVEVCFLGLLGLGDQEIVHIMSRFEPYVGCRMTSHR